MKQTRRKIRKKIPKRKSCRRQRGGNPILINKIDVLLTYKICELSAEQKLLLKSHLDNKTIGEIATLKIIPRMACFMENVDDVYDAADTPYKQIQTYPRLREFFDKFFGMTWLEFSTLTKNKLEDMGMPPHAVQPLLKILEKYKNVDDYAMQTTYSTNKWVRKSMNLEKEAYKPRIRNTSQANMLNKYKLK